MVDTYSFLNEIVASDSAGSGLDIRAYTTKITDELSKLESQCLNDYLIVSSDVDVLSKEIDTQMAILSKIESVVENFQGHIQNVS